MPARPWPLATTLAAVALTTTSCVAGPTITDEKKPAAATAPANTLPTGPRAPNAPNLPTAQASPNGSAIASASPTAPPKIYSVGGDAFEFASSMKVTVTAITDEGAIASGAPGRRRVAVHLQVVNGSSGDLHPYGMLVALEACPAPTGSCGTPGDGPDRKEPSAIAAGTTADVVRYFGVPGTDSLKLARVEIKYNTTHATFAYS
jgi:hypothetical protein